MMDIRWLVEYRYSQEYTLQSGGSLDMVNAWRVLTGIEAVDWDIHHLKLNFNVN
ncbi:MAG: hypothetical protein SVM79_04995 [Chloroflexota bacterium]|nr:hypothetical protein [Chloroflexota bacterium]